MNSSFRLINSLALTLLLGGLLLFSGCKKKIDFVSIFPDRIFGGKSSSDTDADSSDGGLDGATDGSSTQASNQRSGSDNTSGSQFDETGSLLETRQLPPEAADADVIPELPSVTFDYDSDSLSASMRKTLQRHLDFLTDFPDYYIILRGHTDERGTSEYNYSLGARRAQTVREYLALNGIVTERLATLSYGEDLPLSESSSSESLAENRRVDFLVYTLK